MRYAALKARVVVVGLTVAMVAMCCLGVKKAFAEGSTLLNVPGDIPADCNRN